MMRTSLIAFSAIVLPVSAYSVPIVWDAVETRDSVRAAGPSTGQAGQPVPQIVSCGERDAIASELDMQFHEVPTALGVLDETTIMELFVSASGSWTLMSTDTTGQSCIMAVGEGFESNLPLHEAAGLNPPGGRHEKSS
ncbi:hypothetical protein [Mesorhizobium xinjiangense]|uniref:hypothetical protein n=1 Tax=Mesorhizobium xinjiangense TaxID=2678685 RepID=UPI0012ECE208|nr:hypothetical protein [Mesorhizobium xinjiangense]